jgi:hypothetical protein
MTLWNGKTWHTHFKGKTYQKRNHHALIRNIRSNGRYQNENFDTIGKVESKQDLGICTVIPYTSSNKSKRDANGALLREWIRYNVKLGVRVFIYDGGGHNYQNIFNDSDGDALRREPYLSSNLIEYHNFTIRQSIDSTFGSDLRYDNEEQNANLNSTQADVDRRIRFMLQGK